MKTICAALIVKNESKIIRRCLKSIKPHIDYWVICDTGSTDDTKEIISEELSDLPGELHETPWSNFGQNRSVLMALAKGKADYLLLLDADMVLKVHGENFKNGLTADSHFVRNEGSLDYSEKRIVKGNLNWHYEGVTHEHIHSEEEKNVGVCHSVSFLHFCDGARRPKKFLDDIKLLEKGLEDEPDNSRYKFYLAQSYYDTGDYISAIKWYEERIEDGGWEEEVYYSLLRRAICLSQEQEEFPVDAFVQAYNYRPQRLEAIYEIIRFYRGKGMYNFAYILAKEAVKKSYPKKDILFIDREISDYKLEDELSICSYWVGKYEESRELFQKLLEKETVPEKEKERIKKNLRFALDKINQ